MRSTHISFNIRISGRSNCTCRYVFLDNEKIEISTAALKSESIWLRNTEFFEKYDQKQFVWYVVASWIQPILNQLNLYAKTKNYYLILLWYCPNLFFFFMSFLWPSTLNLKIWLSCFLAVFATLWISSEYYNRIIVTQGHRISNFLQVNSRVNLWNFTKHFYFILTW